MQNHMFHINYFWNFLPMVPSFIRNVSTITRPFWHALKVLFAATPVNKFARKCVLKNKDEKSHSRMSGVGEISHFVATGFFIFMRWDELCECGARLGSNGSIAFKSDYSSQVKERSTPLPHWIRKSRTRSTRRWTIENQHHSSVSRPRFCFQFNLSTV